MAKRPSRSKEHRNSAARLLKQSRRSDYAPIRDLLTTTAAAHKGLAHDEEIARGEPQRSRKRMSRTDSR